MRHPDCYHHQQSKATDSNSHHQASNTITNQQRLMRIQIVLLLLLSLSDLSLRSIRTAATTSAYPTIQRRQVDDAGNYTTTDPAITDPKAIQADRIKWYTQDPNQQDHIRLHWLALSIHPPISHDHLSLTRIPPSHPPLDLMVLFEEI